MIGIRQYKLFNFTINCRKDTKDAETPFPLENGRGFKAPDSDTKTNAKRKWHKELQTIKTCTVKAI